MYCCASYSSILGPLTLACNETHLVGLWIDGQKYFGQPLSQPMSPVLQGQEEPEPLKAAPQLAGPVFFRQESPSFGTSLSPRRQRIPPSDLGYLMPDSLWPGCHLRSNRPGGGCADGQTVHVRPGSRECGRTQSHLYHHPLSPCSRLQQKLNRLRRRNREKNPTSEAGRSGFIPIFRS